VSNDNGATWLQGGDDGGGRSCLRSVSSRSTVGLAIPPSAAGGSTLHRAPRGRPCPRRARGAGAAHWPRHGATYRRTAGSLPAAPWALHACVERMSRQAWLARHTFVRGQALRDHQRRWSGRALFNHQQQRVTSTGDTCFRRIGSAMSLSDRNTNPASVNLLPPLKACGVVVHAGAPEHSSPRR